MRRTKEEAALTRDAVLKAALPVFSAKGYAATTLEDVAQAAGVTRGAIYWHFKNKADLYATMLDGITAAAGAVAQDAVAEGGDLATVLRRIFVNQLTAIDSDRRLQSLVALSLNRTEQVPELATRRKKQTRAGKATLAELTALMEEGIRAGAFRSDLDPADAARAFLALQNGAIQLWLVTQRGFSLSTSAEGLADILLNGLAA